MIKVYFRDFDWSPKGVSFLPTVPRIGESIIIMLDGSQDVHFRVVDVCYEHYTPRNYEGNLIYENCGPAGPTVTFAFESVQVVVEATGGENPPDFPYSPPRT